MEKCTEKLNMIDKKLNRIDKKLYEIHEKLIDLVELKTCNEINEKIYREQHEKRLMEAFKKQVKKRLNRRQKHG